MWERGLKQKVVVVSVTCSLSLPMWERGLKQASLSHSARPKESLPMWERGLKPGDKSSRHHVADVAPHVGAWIETPLRIFLPTFQLVAPHVGAWIETT